MLENIKEILAIAVTSLSLVITLLTFIAKNSKNIKLRKIANNLLKITNEVNNFVVLAEEFTNYNGNDKKEWVTTKVKEYCITNNIKYNEEDISNAIENAVLISKRVNKRDKDKAL